MTQGVYIDKDFDFYLLKQFYYPPTSRSISPRKNRIAVGEKDKLTILGINQRFTTVIDFHQIIADIDVVNVGWKSNDTLYFQVESDTSITFYVINDRYIIHNNYANTILYDALEKIEVADLKNPIFVDIGEYGAIEKVYSEN